MFINNNDPISNKGLIKTISNKGLIKTLTKKVEKVVKKFGKFGNGNCGVV